MTSSWKDFDFCEESGPTTTREAMALLEAIENGVQRGEAADIAAWLMLERRYQSIHRRVADAADGSQLRKEESRVLELLGNAPGVLVADRLVLLGQVGFNLESEGESLRGCELLEASVKLATENGLLVHQANLGRQLALRYLDQDLTSEAIIAASRARTAAFHNDLLGGVFGDRWQRHGCLSTEAYCSMRLGNRDTMTEQLFAWAETEYQALIGSARGYMDRLPGAHYCEWLWSTSRHREVYDRVLVTLRTALGEFNRGYDLLNLARAEHGLKADFGDSAEKAIQSIRRSGRKNLLLAALISVAQMKYQRMESRELLPELLEATELSAFLHLPYYERQLAELKATLFT